MNEWRGFEPPVEPKCEWQVKCEQAMEECARLEEGNREMRHKIQWYRARLGLIEGVR